jgi:retinoid hydroxylase
LRIGRASGLSSSVAEAWLDQIPGSGSFLELPRMLRDPIGFLEQRHRLHGDIFKTRWVMPVVFLVGPKANKLIHVTQRERFSYEKSYGELAIGRMFERSLIVEDGEPHQRDRGILQPAVGRLGLSQVVDEIAGAWERAAERSIPNNTPLDVYRFVRDVTFEVSANALVGLEMGEELDRLKPLFQRMIEGATANLTLRIPFGKIDRGLRARKQLIEYLMPKIREARTKDTGGMLGLLAQYRAPDGSTMSDERIAEHVLFLFWAGYDTTASTGAWTLLEIARSPEWQQRLREESARVLGTKRLSMDQLDLLPDHDAVLREIERLRPVVLFFPRRTTEPIEVDGKHVPKDAFVFYSPYLTHRIASLFPEPDTFDPGRWLADGGAKAPSQALVGFGGGPRICLGKTFALLQLKVLLTTILRRYRLEVDPSRRPKTISLPTHRPDAAIIARNRS